MQLAAAPCAPSRGRSRRRAPAGRVLAVSSPQRARSAPQQQQQSTPAWAARFAHNPALAGNFAPVEREVFLPSLRVDGTLPPSCDGVFLRNGPNPRFPPDMGGYHWFDGEGMIHFLRLRGAGDGGAEYGCRFVRTRGFAEDERAGKRTHLSLTQRPMAGPILRGLASKGLHWACPDSPYWVIQTPNNANNGVKFHAGRLLATYEAGSAYELELSRELRSLGVCSFGGAWGTVDFWTENFTAHSKVDPATGELLYMGYNLVPVAGPPTVTVGVVDAGGRITHRATLPVSRPSMQHDMGITATRTVLVDGPLVFNLSKASAGERPFDFHRGAPLRFGVLPRRGGAADVVWVAAECCFAYHVVNCWDDPEHPDRVVVVLCRMRETHALGMADGVQLGPDGSALPAARDAGATVPFAEEACLHRFVLDLAQRRVVESAPLAPMPSDFPAVHPAAVGRPARFAFSAGVASGAGAPHAITLFDALLKHDLRSGGVTRRALRPGVYCGDVAFAPRVPGAPLSATSDGASDGSDDGHVLLLTHDVAAQTAELLVLDARDICADPVAVVHVPLRVPFGFHCEWVPGPLPLWETGGPGA